LTLGGALRREYAIGGIGPVEEERGAHARLVNLGFDGEPDGAVRAYQRTYGLEPTCVADAPTCARLLEHYGG
jgi:hypothetical protein